MAELSVTEIVEHLHKTLKLPKQPQDIESLRTTASCGLNELVAVMAKNASLPCTVRLRVVEHKRTKPLTRLAWVMNPAKIPPYGSRSLGEETIDVFTYDIFLSESSFESIVFTIAHELSHIVLWSTRSMFAPSERATDVCAMMLGYDGIALASSIYSRTCSRVISPPWWKRVIGIKSEHVLVTEDLRLGYLSADEYRTAIEDITFIRALRSVTART